MNLQRILISTLLLLFVAGLAYKGYEEYMMSLKTEQTASQVENEDVLGGLEVGRKAPDFELASIDGEETALSQYRGETIVLNFWASWCPPCREEFPELITFSEEEGIPVLGVNVTKNERRGVEDVEAFLEEVPASFPILLDRTGSVEQTYRIVALPTTYVIDRDGVIVAKHTGPVDGKWLRQHTGESSQE